MALGDFNTDGNPDVAVLMRTDATTNRVQFFSNDGTGDYSSHWFANFGAGDTGGVGIAAADLDRDGDGDVAVLGNEVNTNGIRRDVLWLLWNDGNTNYDVRRRELSSNQLTVSGSALPRGVVRIAELDFAKDASSNLNGPDIVIALPQGDITVYANLGGAVGGDHAARFPDPLPQSQSQIDYLKLDVNTNKLTDMVLGNFDGTTNGLNYPDLAVSFTPPSTGGNNLVALKNHRPVDAADVFGGSATSGAFTDITAAMADDFPRRLAVGDMNGDGLQEIVTANDNAVAGTFFVDTVSVLRNVTQPAGPITFAHTPTDNYPVYRTPAALDIGDFNGDGRMDVGVLEGKLCSDTPLAPTSGCAPDFCMSIFLGNGLGKLRTQSLHGDPLAGGALGGLGDLPPGAAAVAPAER